MTFVVFDAYQMAVRIFFNRSSLPGVSIQSKRRRFSKPNSSNRYPSPVTCHANAILDIEVPPIRAPLDGRGGIASGRDGHANLWCASPRPPGSLHGDARRCRAGWVGVRRRIEDDLIARRVVSDPFRFWKITA